MPRVNTVKKSRKDQGPCSKCGKEIKKGDGYLYWEFAFGPTYKRCAEPGCRPTASDLTRSEYLKAVYDLQDRKIEGPFIEDMKLDVENLISDIQDLGSEQEDKLSNMPDSLQSAPSGELLQERIDQCQDVVSQLESIDFDIDEEDAKDEDKLSDKIEEIKNAVQDALGSLA